MCHAPTFEYCYKLNPHVWKQLLKPVKKHEIFSINLGLLQKT